jgi:hypothetical protein
MTRTLLIVPRMYAKSEFKEVASHIPDDYDAKYEEFWSYVTDKLRVFRGRIRKVFRESLSRNTEEALRTICGDDERGYSLIVELLKEGAELEPTEDPILVTETESWLKMIKSTSRDVLLELYEESLAERSRYVTNLITHSLEEGEVGLIIIDSRRKLELPTDYRVIRICPFDPADYINAEIIKAKLKSRT